MMKFILVLWFSISSAWCQTPIHSPIYLYASESTSAFLKSQQKSHHFSLFRWRKFLKIYKKDVKQIVKADLLAHLPPGLLILPSTLILDEEERQAIQTFTAAGGSLLATGATGTLNADGQTRGFDFLESQFHLRVTGEFKSNSDWFIMPFGDAPLTWALPAGRRISMGTEPQSLLRVETNHAAALFMDWIRAKDESGNNVAIAFNESGSNRSVFFAFPESVWGFHKPSDMRALLKGVVSWLRHEPKVFKAAWPNGLVAAHLIEMDTEDKFPSALNLASDLESIGKRGTFYCLTSEAIKYPDIVKKLLSRGHEIAYHADIHVGFKDIEASDQEARLLTMKKQMRQILGDASQQVTGFRAPTEGYDITTETLLHKHHILHHAADPSSTQDRLPFFSVSDPELDPSQALVVLPRTELDDVNFKRLTYGTEKVKETLSFDLSLIVRSGAFGLLSVHSQNYVEGGLMRLSMSDYMQQVDAYKDQLWVARGEQITSWWRAREPVEVKQMPTENPNQIKIKVQTPSVVEGLTIMVTLPYQKAQLAIQATSGTNSKARLKKIDDYRSALIFDRLEVGETNLEVVL